MSNFSEGQFGNYFPDPPILPESDTLSEPIPPALLALESPSVPVPAKPHATAPAQHGRRFSRRVALVGLAGLVPVAGGIAWLTLLRKSPIGTIIYTYRAHTDDVYDAEWSPDG